MVAVNGLNAPAHITQSIKLASQQTGVDFSYLMHQAKAESSFDAQAKAKTSSATGLFQFIENTWLNLADKYGAKYGLEGLNREQLLAKRNDPKISSLMAAELAQENKAALKNKVGGDIGAVDLYFAHFLGASGASEFLINKMDNGDAKAAYDFQSASKANKSVFFHSDGTAKTYNEIYDHFASKFNSIEKPNLNSDKPSESQLIDTQLAQKTVPDYDIAPMKQRYTAIPMRELNAFDADVQKFVSMTHLLDLQMLQVLKEQDVALLQSRSNFFQSSYYSLFE